MANKFVSFGPSICRGIRHFRGLKVPKWDALSRYTALRYMSSIVDRKFSSPFHKSEQIDQSRRSTRKANLLLCSQADTGVFMRFSCYCLI